MSTTTATNEHEQKKTHTLIIIGGGCAGLTAAIYAARDELTPIVFTGDPDTKGGLLTKTSVVENYPGFPDGINGFDLIQRMEAQAIIHGATIIDKKITKVNLSASPYSVIDDTNNIYYTHMIIIATGSNAIKLGLDRENEFWGRGISSCAVCDGALFKGKKIVVVGGGDSAMEEATFLTKFSNVLLIHRRNMFRASKSMQNRVLSNPRIKIMYDTVIEKFIGKSKGQNRPKLEAIEVKKNDNEKSEIMVDGVFYGLGLTPNTDIFRHQLSVDSDGYINTCDHKNNNNNQVNQVDQVDQVDQVNQINQINQVDQVNQINHVDHVDHVYTTSTSVPGVFVAGDAHDKVYRQAVIACGDGCRAAMDASKYYLAKKIENNIH
jgi:thioredoxin reductase (NADPH)